VNLVGWSISDEKTTLYQWFASRILWLLEQGLSQTEQGNELSELGTVDANQGTSPK
jgi:hypothetical protein